MGAWKVLSSKYLLKERWITVRADKCLTTNGTVVEPYYVLEYPDWIACFVVDKNDDVLMIDYYRHGVGKVVRELVGGIIDPGENPKQTALREVREELGYVGGEIYALKNVYANPCMQTNRVHSFIVIGGEITSDQHLDDSEEIKVVKVSIDEVRAMCSAESSDMQAYHMLCAYSALEFLDARNQQT